MLDLDETLIHSHHDGVLRPTVRPGTPPDFILKVCAEYGTFVAVLTVSTHKLSLPRFRVRAWQDLAPGSARRRKVGSGHGAGPVWQCLGVPLPLCCSSAGGNRQTPSPVFCT